MIFWAALGILTGSLSVLLLARGARRLIETAAVGGLLVGAAARVVTVAALGVAAFLSGPANGLAFLAGLGVARSGTVKLLPQRWLG